MDSTYDLVKQRVLMRAEASDVLSSISVLGFWIKDFKFRFLEISERAAKLLYDCDSNFCIGKSDFEIAKELNLTMVDEQQFAEVCRASDEYVLSNDKDGKYQVFRFVEFLKDTRGNMHIWRTIKGIHPDLVGEGKYFFGQAVFCDEILGSYDMAFKSFEREKPILTKLNDYLYLYNNTY